MTEYTGLTWVQPIGPRNPFEKTWFTPSREDLAPGTPLREAVEEALSSWHPNYADDNGRITSYDEWLESLESGVAIPGHPDWYFEPGSDFTEAPWTTLKTIAKNLAKELR